MYKGERLTDRSREPLARASAFSDAAPSVRTPIISSRLVEADRSSRFIVSSSYNVVLQ